VVDEIGLEGPSMTATLTATLTATVLTATVLTGTAVLLVAVRFTPKPPTRLIRVRRRGFCPRLPANPARTRLMLGVMILTAATALALALGPMLVIAAWGGVLIGPPLRRARARRSRQRQIRAALPDMIELLMLLIHAGSTPTRALRELHDYLSGPIAEAVGAVIHRLDRGVRLADALEELPAHLGPLIRPLVEGIAAADRYGLPLTPVLDRAATELRTSRQRAGEAHARTMSVRLSFPLVVCTLPSFVLLAILPAVMGAVSSIRGVGP
jgi:Flp pilus assembly protein TadB